MGDLAGHIDGDRAALCGWSFGGWTALATPEADDRFRAVVGLAPGGSSNPLPGMLALRLTFTWQRDVATLLLDGRERPGHACGGHRLTSTAPRNRSRCLS